MSPRDPTGGKPAVAGSLAARKTASDLRAIFLSDRAAFEAECDRILAKTTDPVTRRFWEDVKRFASTGESE